MTGLITQGIGKHDVARPSCGAWAPNRRTNVGWRAHLLG